MAAVQGIQGFLTDESLVLDWLQGVGAQILESTSTVPDDLDDLEPGEAPLTAEERAMLREQATAAQIKSTLKAARDLALQLQSALFEAIPRCVQRIVVHEDKIEIGLNLAALLVNESDLNSEAELEPIWLTVPAQLKRCGMAIRLIVQAPDVARQRAPDLKLLALLAKAHAWFRQLSTGDATSMTVIANEEEVGAPYVSRVVYLAFLAPDIVQQISKGEQPPTLNADKLIRMVPLPADWGEQRKLLGMIADGS